MMNCPRCNSENIQIQARPAKKPIMLGCVLAAGGFGMLILGILGALLGVILGAVVGAVIKALSPASSEAVAICQACGYVSNAIDQSIARREGHPLFCTADESNFVISRTGVSCGSAIGLRVIVDNYEPFVLSNGMVINLKLNQGQHKIYYEQAGGLGKKNRQGYFDVYVIDDCRYYASMTFTNDGLLITKSW